MFCESAGRSEFPGRAEMQNASLDRAFGKHLAVRTVLQGHLRTAIFGIKAFVISKFPSGAGSAASPLLEPVTL